MKFRILKPPSPSLTHLVGKEGQAIASKLENDTESWLLVIEGQQYWVPAEFLKEI